MMNDEYLLLFVLYVQYSSLVDVGGEKGEGNFYIGRQRTMFSTAKNLRTLQSMDSWQTGQGNNDNFL